VQSGCGRALDRRRALHPVIPDGSQARHRSRLRRAVSSVPPDRPGGGTAASPACRAGSRTDPTRLERGLESMSRRRAGRPARRRGPGAPRAPG
jgi:hypothetical protein